MDRNTSAATVFALLVNGVALRKESVDRNMCFWLSGRLSMVALRKESVDRNLYLLWQFGRAFWSLSARRAWIEIIKCAVRRIKVCSRSPQGERG